jgi:tetratricopeptide (TPR) repeat protein
MRQLLAHHNKGSLAQALGELASGTGDIAQRVFGTTFRRLSLRGQTALCALSVVPQMDRDALRSFTGDINVSGALRELSEWSLAYHSDDGHVWWLTGLTRTLAQARVFPVLDGWLKEHEAGNATTAASLLAFWGTSELQGFLKLRGFWPQRMRYGKAVLKVAQAGGDKRTIALIGGHLADAAQDVGDWEQARQGYQAALQAFRELSDEGNVATALHNLGTLAQHQGQYEEARGLYQESLALEQRLGDAAGIAISLHQLGMLAQRQGQYEEARERYQEALKSFEALGAVFDKAAVLHQLGVLGQGQGQYQEAHRLYQESLALARKLGDAAGIATTVAQIGLLAEQQGQLSEAEQCLKEALETFRRLQSPYAQQAERSLARVREKLKARGQG